MCPLYAVLMKCIFYAVNQTFVSLSVVLLFLFQSLKASAQTHELIVFFAAHAWFEFVFSFFLFFLQGLFLGLLSGDMF